MKTAKNQALKRGIIALLLYSLLMYIMTISAYPHGISWFLVLCDIALGIALFFRVYKKNLRKK
jgi:hypothetical protein